MNHWLLAIVFTIVYASLLANNAQAQTLTPQGRLTLTSNTPVMSSDVTNATAIYYAPYIGNAIPIYGGSSFSNNTFSQLTMTLNSSNQTSGNIYDLFVFLNSSTVTIGAGPAWTSSTGRGSGTGTTQLQQINGLWVNNNIITLTNGATTYSNIPVGEATYVGSVYMTSAGETTVNFKPSATSGGSKNFIGLWNAYNRVPIESISRDSASSWTYSSSTWREADASSSNRISWLDGLQQTAVWGRYSVLAAVSASPGAPYVGINLDSATATPNVPSAMTFGSATNWNFMLAAEESFPPQLGLHYLQAMENETGTSVTTTFYGDTGSQFQSLIARLEY